MTHEAWQSKRVLLLFEEEGKDTINAYEGKITNWNHSGGGQEPEGVRTFGDRRINKFPPMEDIEVSFDIIFTDTSFYKMWLGTPATGQQATSGDDVAPLRWRVIIWYTVDALRGTATTRVVPKTGEHFRLIFKDCRTIVFEAEHASDDLLKGTLRFKLSAVDDVGKANLFSDRTANQATTALTVLTTTHGGVLTWSTTTNAWTASYRT